MASLLSDVLHQIFENYQNDFKSLHSCLLVDRLWCVILNSSITPPLFDYIEFCKVLDFNIIGNIINEGYEGFIINEGFTINEEGFIVNEGIITTTTNVNEGFPFPVNEVNEDGFTINEEGYEEIKKVNQRIDEYYQLYLIRQEICKLFVNRCSKIKHLSITTIMPHPLPYLPGSNLLFSHLTQLSCNPFNDESIYFGIAQICFNIKNLIIINFDKDNIGLAKLIEVQNNLESLECQSNIFHHNLLNFSFIGNSLITQKNSLKHLNVINNICIPPKIIYSLINLESLKYGIEDSNVDERITDEYSYPLFSAKFPKLQHLTINSCPSFRTASNLISQTNGQLRKIYIGYSNYDFDYAGTLINSIANNCPLLESLSICYFKNYRELRKLLNSCKYLQYIKKWRDRKPLIFYTIKAEFINEKHENIFNRFKEEGVLKKYVNEVDWLLDD
ncbi:1431_t:CDS:2 [Diversispora eburnea]|uniref:1431_t:CDS:1 n=1 Tax=Diversispora eburnea TaxID=1213867 RepID=A0A9N8WCW3_9GLOM|nr:1431_t:CDS:2 [Diversispora eburnea]